MTYQNIQKQKNPNRSQTSRAADRKIREKYKTYSNYGSEKNRMKKSIYDDLIKCGFSLSQEDFSPITKEEHKLIRIDFHGCVHKPKDGFSKSYQNYQEVGKIGRFKTEDYNDLKDWPLWQICEQSQNFQGIRCKIISYLQQNSIHPASLPSFNMYDFQDILYEAFKDRHKARVAHVFEGQKSKFVKYMATEYEEDIKQMFIALGESEKKATIALNKMKTYGITEFFSLNKQGQPIQDLDVVLTVHHKKPVASATTKQKNIFETNHFSNFCLIINNKELPLHQIIHIFDKKKRVENPTDRLNYNEQIIQTMHLPQNTALMMSLNKEFWIIKEFSKEYNNQSIKTNKKYTNEESEDNDYKIKDKPQKRERSR